MTKTVNDEVLEFLRSYIAGGVNQDFKPWARELYAKLYGSSAEPTRKPGPCSHCGGIQLANGVFHRHDCPDSMENQVKRDLNRRGE